MRFDTIFVYMEMSIGDTVYIRNPKNLIPERDTIK